MVYKLRFVQKFKKANQALFLHIEKKFIELEKTELGLPIGKRFLPVTGKEASNTLIWEAEFGSMEDVVSALRALEENTQHDELLVEQIEYMSDTYSEIYKQFE